MKLTKDREPNQFISYLDLKLQTKRLTSIELLGQYQSYFYYLNYLNLNRIIKHFFYKVHIIMYVCTYIRCVFYQEF